MDRDRNLLKIVHITRKSSNISSKTLISLIFINNSNLYLKKVKHWHYEHLLSYMLLLYIYIVYASCLRDKSLTASLNWHPTRRWGVYSVDDISFSYVLLDIYISPLLPNDYSYSYYIYIFYCYYDSLLWAYSPIC